MKKWLRKRSETKKSVFGIGRNKTSINWKKIVKWRFLRKQMTEQETLREIIFRNVSTASIVILIVAMII